MSANKTLLVGVSIAAIAAAVWYTTLREPTSHTPSSSQETVAEQLTFNEYLDKVFWDGAKRAPQFLSQLRHFEAQGITEHNGRLNDLSVARAKENIEIAKKNYAALMAFDDASLNEGQRFNKALSAYQLERQIAGERFMFHGYPLTQLFSWHNNVTGFLTGTHSVLDAQEAGYYVDRLKALRTQFDQLKEQMAVSEEMGVVPPTFILDKVLMQLSGFVTEDPKQNAFYVGFKGKLDRLEDMSAADKEALLAQTKETIVSVVYPIWAELAAYTTSLKAKSTNDAGVWKLPDGAAYYQNQLEQFTTTNMTAEEIHALGLSEVDRIQSEMTALFEVEGYDTSKSFVELIGALAEEERHYYPDTDEGRAQIIADYTAMIDEINAGVADQFNMKPKAAVEVVRVPVFLERGAPGGYYNRPALDGSRPGRFYANLYDIKATPKYGMRALTYHEAVPGHHYQIALQQEQQGLPWFRKFIGYTAYIEGWALYAERVALEMGFQKTNFDKIGALQSELFRAVRLVVDTGMHAKKWTREEAIEYMADNTGMAMSDVVTEIERYIVWPGQATAYKIGQLSILKLRDDAKQALGDKFDIREFHDLVLNGGAVPLTILEEQVQAYIASKQ
jgi:uncharacterized protein (DUF885 family)